MKSLRKNSLIIGTSLLFLFLLSACNFNGRLTTGSVCFSIDNEMARAVEKTQNTGDRYPMLLDVKLQSIAGEECSGNIKVIVKDGARVAFNGIPVDTTIVLTANVYKVTNMTKPLYTGKSEPVYVQEGLNAVSFTLYKVDAPTIVEPEEEIDTSDPSIDTTEPVKEKFVKFEAEGFEISDHEVTQKEWYDLMDVSQKEMCSTDYGRGNNYPVYNVNWYAAIAYCNKRSAKEGLECVYSIEGINSWADFNYSKIPVLDDAKWNNVTADFTKNGYRLPKETEWECAAGTNEGVLSNFAWYSENSESKAHEVCKKQPNTNKVYDMRGNVYEWCWDLYGGSTGTIRTIRGGCWCRNSSHCDVSNKSSCLPASSYEYIGFRLVRTLKSSD